MEGRCGLRPRWASRRWTFGESIAVTGNDASVAVLRAALHQLDGGVTNVRVVTSETVSNGTAGGPGHSVITGTSRAGLTKFHGQDFSESAVVPVTEIVEWLLGRVPIDLVASDPWFVRISSVQRLGRGYTLVKRTLDVGVAIGLGLVVLPLVAALAVAIRIASAGPVLDRRQCAGADGSVFTSYRFRTSREARAMENQAVGSVAALGPNCVGRLLRRSRLDGLPAIWNVLRGDMALVGPRPVPVNLAELRAQELPGYRLRHAAVPGLTGWSQLRTRRAPRSGGPRRELEYDLYYVKHASLVLDLRILAATLVLIAGAAARLAISSLVSSTALLKVKANGMLPTPRRGGWTSVTTRLDARWNGQVSGRPNLERVLIVGAGEGGKLIVREMRRNPAWELSAVAFVDDDVKKIGTRRHGLPVLGDTTTISAVVEREGIDVVVIAIPSAKAAEMARLSAHARKSSARVLTMPDIGALLRGHATPGALHVVQANDVLGRPMVASDIDRCRSFIAGRRVLITGAAGSIGHELTCQVAELSASQIVALDINESGLFDLQHDVAMRAPGVDLRPVVASVTHPRRLANVFARYQPEIVFHAAAYKHVPLMEENADEAVMVNVIGSYEVAQAAAAVAAQRFVLVSTDKAVHPTSVMGATKRLAELAVRAVAEETGLWACSVRFGNVLGSRGSVIPTFQKQIDAGGPVTVTDPEMKRYFMTITEAVSLIVETGAFGTPSGLYVLDMGEEVSILELAERMIHLKGLRVGKDIQIVFTGSRPGEKLREELVLDTEIAEPTVHPKIRLLKESTERMPSPAVRRALERLAEPARNGEIAQVRSILFDIVEAADGRWPGESVLVPVVMSAATVAG